jgi:ribosome-associated protein
MIMNSKTGDDSAEEWISKSQRKRDCDRLQSISDQLLKLKPEDIALIDLPNELKDALNEAHHIHSNSALKRQRQYLGKIMRACDSEKIEQQLNAVIHRNDTNTAQFKKIEKWRDRLLDNDRQILGEIILQLPDLDRHHVHNLVRQAAREAAAEKPPSASRKLFKYLREISAASGE